MPAHSANCAFLDFPVARHRGHFAGDGIFPDSMRPALANEIAALRPQMPLEIEQLHDATRCNGRTKGVRPLGVIQPLPDPISLKIQFPTGHDGGSASGDDDEETLGMQARGVVSEVEVWRLRLGPIHI